MVFGIPTSVLVGAGAAIFGAAFGAVVQERLRTRKRRRNLRVALKAELDSMIALEQLELPDEVETAEELGMPGYDMLPTTVFDANAADIGLLSKPEVKEITTFYSSSYTTKSQMAFLQDEREKIILTEGQMSTQEFEDIVRATHQLIKKLKAQREAAIQSIEESME